MKTEHYESEVWFELILSPETMKEVSECLRFARNAKSETPAIYFTFDGDQPKLCISLRKRSRMNQIKSVRPS